MQMYVFIHLVICIGNSWVFSFQEIELSLPFFFSGYLSCIYRVKSRLDHDYKGVGKKKKFVAVEFEIYFYGASSIRYFLMKIYAKKMLKHIDQVSLTGITLNWKREVFE